MPIAAAGSHFGAAKDALQQALGCLRHQQGTNRTRQVLHLWETHLLEPDPIAPHFQCTQALGLCALFLCEPASLLSGRYRTFFGSTAQQSVGWH